MIPKLQTAGKSFKGLAAYLTHDPKAKTAERVAWTHTLNCAFDDVPTAVDSMLWTARNAELLKMEAGIRAGGRAAESPVKHFSLSWAIGENPSREHMIETTEDFLRHMKWQDHQAILVCHNDREFAHVHGMINAVHPETGLMLDDSFERRRASKWALEYEREHGHIYCEQRLLNPNEREDAPTRSAWLAFAENKKEFERAEKFMLENARIFDGEENKSKIANFDEWKMLKEIQKRERLDFLAEGKSEFRELRNAIYRGVREDFRDRWADFYEAKKKGLDAEALADIKAELISDQKEILEARRDVTCEALRASRDGAYRELLDDQREIRAGMRWRQEAGLDNKRYLELVEERSAVRDMRTAFFDSAEEVATHRGGRSEIDLALSNSPKHERTGVKSGTDVGANLGVGLGFGVLSFFESIADGLIGGKPAPRPRQPEPEPLGPNPFVAANDDAQQRQRHERVEAESEWLKRQRSYGE